jgi:ribose-phosphate pyrophosphokinase
MRQDAAFNRGEAISQRAVGGLIARIVDRVVTVDAHLHRTHKIGDVFPGIQAEDISAIPAIAETLCSAIDPRTIVVGPDEESRDWVQNLATVLQLESTVAHKLRQGDRSVEITFPEPDAVRGRPVLLVDDIVSSGVTLTVCAQTLKRAGATAIDAIITHALFPPEDMERFARAGIRAISSTTSVSHPTNRISLDKVLAEALQNEVKA